ncbi:MAG TPA: hypothetical protein VHM70_19405 [Polyangiaceae bacterium]|nr:hypothetical protein [Polyangiaceae bacterium]
MTPCCDITISDAGSILKLGPFSSHGEFSFTCRNLLKRSFPGRIEVIGVAEAGSSNTLPSWISAAPKQEFDADATLVLAVRAQLPSGTAAQRIQFKLRVSNELSPNEEYAESRVVAIEVESATPKAPPKWLIPVLALCSAAIAICGGLIWFLSGPKLGDSCDPKAPKCPAGIACNVEEKRCLAVTDAICKKPEECLSRGCDKVCLPPLSVGKACEPKGQKCAEGSACVSDKCLANLDQHCSSSAECATGRCSKAGTCIAAAKGRSQTFTSDDTWTSFAADDNGKSGNALGNAKLVCAASVLQNCPAGALQYGPPLSEGWKADLSKLPGAKWIWRADVKEMDVPQIAAFEKTFELGPDPSGTLLIAADDFAEVRVNGTKIGSIGSITDAPKALDAQSALHPFDLTTALHSGSNTITIIGKNSAWEACATALSGPAPSPPPQPPAAPGGETISVGGLGRVAYARRHFDDRAVLGIDLGGFEPPPASTCWHPAGVVFGVTLSD